MLMAVEGVFVKVKAEGFAAVSSLKVKSKLAFKPPPERPMSHPSAGGNWVLPVKPKYSLPSESVINQPLKRTPS